MIEPIFADPRLVAIYDHFDGARGDLAAYLSIVKELRAKSVLDVGCGTGCFAILLRKAGLSVTGLEPARASLDFARAKKGADEIQWILGDASKLPALAVDLAVMTGNVAQVFLTDEAWEENLEGIRQALQPKGHLVFEVRDPAKKAWLDWTREKSYQRLLVPGIGYVSAWCEVTSAVNELVSFRWTYTFEASGQVLESLSTLRFRERNAIAASLEKLGYRVLEVRDAPDRPGKEFVFIAGVS